jgi:5'(3')-deoxyribonucleotidase
MSFENLTEENILLYAAKAYDKPNCVMSEFTEDIKKLNYLKRLFRRYRKHGEMRERLIINHIVVLYNLFGPEVTARLLFYNMNKDDYSILKTYLTFLNIMPERVRGINGKDILSSDIMVDMNIANELRNLK